MRFLAAVERRLQDLERRFQNSGRMGEIVDVKFDKEKRRWYVKLNDGSDLTPSGQNSGSSSGDTFKSDWIPWMSFSHGTIKKSVPPKKGQKALLRSPGGTPELALAEPFHYGPNTPSPHDKEDEIVTLIEDEDDEKGEQGQGQSQGDQQGKQDQQQDKWNTWLREAKDTFHLIIQKKKSQDQGSGGQSAKQADGKQSSKQKTRTLPEVPEDGDEKTLQVKATKDGWLVTHGKSKAKIKLTESDITLNLEDVEYKMTKDEVYLKKGDGKVSVKSDVITAGFGTQEARLVIKKGKGSKIAMEDNFIAVAKGGQLLSSKPIIVGGDPVGD